MNRHRDVMGDSFSFDVGEEVDASDPMSGLSNLADCMLVLACGLMITLVVHWNLNITPQYEVVEETGDLVEVEGDPELAVKSEDGSGEGGEALYENMGTLYRDAETGKLYYLRDTE